MTSSGQTLRSLDITRANASKHQSFGNGVHHCLGANLAKMEGEIAVSRLVRRFPDLRLAVEPHELEWAPRIILRGLRELPVALAA